MPWELLRPAGLALLGLAIPLVALYVLKIRRERRVVPSVWLWRAAARDLQAKSPFRKLIPSVPLILESLALALLALALAGPVTRTDRHSDARAILVIDVSASMGAVEDGQSRFARAIRAARDELRRFAPGTEIMVLSAGRTAELVAPFERDRRRLEAALERLAVQEVEGQLGQALAMAADQLRERGGGRLVVVTDGAVADAETLAAPNVPFDIIRVDGGGGDNTAIVRTEVARGPDPTTGHDRVEVFALVAHHGTRPRDVFVTLTQRNVVEPLASRHLRLSPGERVPVALGFDAGPSDAGTGLMLELSPPDALASDDRTAVRVPTGKKLPVVLAPKRANVWVERALRADPDVELYSTDLAGLTPENVPPDALVVVDGACPERLPGADILLLAPPEGPCRTVQVGPALDRPLITSWTETDPRLRHLTFDGVDIARARHLMPEREGDGLVRSQRGALIADVSSEGRTGTLVGFDVGESNWPLRASFVLFVRNVVELARAHRDNTLSAPVRTGEPIRLRVPLDVETVTAEYPSGRREPIPARAGLAVVPGPLQVGFVHVSWGGSRPGSTLVPASLSSDAESRLTPRPLPPSVAEATRSSRTSGLAGFEWLLAALALVLLALDIAWVTRRPRRRLEASGPLPDRRPRPLERELPSGAAR